MTKKWQGSETDNYKSHLPHKQVILGSTPIPAPINKEDKNER